LSEQRARYSLVDDVERIEKRYRPTPTDVRDVIVDADPIFWLYLADAIKEGDDALAGRLVRLALESTEGDTR
jgi:hypothetical protein